MLHGAGPVDLSEYKELFILTPGVFCSIQGGPEKTERDTSHNKYVDAITGISVWDTQKNDTAIFGSVVP